MPGAISNTFRVLIYLLFPTTLWGRDYDSQFMDGEANLQRLYSLLHYSLLFTLLQSHSTGKSDFRSCFLDHSVVAFRRSFQHALPLFISNIANTPPRKVSCLIFTQNRKIPDLRGKVCVQCILESEWLLHYLLLCFVSVSLPIILV